MSASVAWLSVTAKKGSHVVLPAKIVKCSWEDTFAELLVKASKELQTSTVCTVRISKSDLFMNSQEVSVDAPLSVCDHFGCKYVCYMLCIGETINDYNYK